jgi:hypothetical protein
VADPRDAAHFAVVNPTIVVPRSASVVGEVRQEFGELRDAVHFVLVNPT